MREVNTRQYQVSADEWLANGGSAPPLPFPGLTWQGMLLQSDGSWLPHFEPVEPKDRPSINTAEGWNACRRAGIEKDLAQRLGRSPTEEEYQAESARQIAYCNALVQGLDVDFETFGRDTEAILSPSVDLEAFKVSFREEYGRELPPAGERQFPLLCRLVNRYSALGKHDRSRSRPPKVSFSADAARLVVGESKVSNELRLSLEALMKEVYMDGYTAPDKD